ncbi:MAG: hypothetical protein B7C24_00140 [Bacteroidetes bacterium 4572_77]|nr:MAG: hypothetical protein B7C24_00140 [Bacteroidetes bacterium 4572_77]
MDRGLSQNKILHLIIAFAISWLSVSSIIGFHITRIYHKDFNDKIEYLKTDQKKSFKEKLILIKEKQLKLTLCLCNGDFQKRYKQNLSDYVCYAKTTHVASVTLNTSKRGPPQV